MDENAKLAAIAQSPELEAVRAMIEGLAPATLMRRNDIAYVGGAIERLIAEFPAPAASE